MVCCASHFVRRPSISFMCSHFRSCMVVFAHVQLSSFMHGLLHLLSGCGGRCLHGHLSFMGGLIVVHGWRVIHGGVIIIQGQVSPSMGGALSSAGGAWPSMGGARHCLWMVRLVTCCGLSVKVDIVWVVGIHESGGHGVGVRVGVGIHIGVVGESLSFTGGTLSLSVDRASLWWVGSLCMGLSVLSLCFMGRGSWCC